MAPKIRRQADSTMTGRWAAVQGGDPGAPRTDSPPGLMRGTWRLVRRAAVLAAWVHAAGCALHHPSQTTPTTVILVRHADRAATPFADPPLTMAGLARAHDLAIALRDAGVQAIITTQFGRTKATAAPLAELLGLMPEVVPDTGPSHARTVARLIFDRYAGQTILVVGHGHTVPAIIAELGAVAPPPICESVYDGLYIVTVPIVGRARVVQTRYGAPSSPDSSCVSGGTK